MWDEKNTGNNLPAQIELYATDRRRLQVPVHGEGRRLGQQELPVPGDEGGAQPDEPHAVPRREAAHARHRGLPAVPPRGRHRRHERGVHAQGGEVRERALPRHAADDGQRARPRLPRRRARAADPAAHRTVRHRRAVRRQVLLPRRARDPPAPPRRFVSRSASRCRARPTGRRSARSPPTASSSKSSNATRRSTCPRPPTTTCPPTSCASTSTVRWTTSAPSCRSFR